MITKTLALAATLITGEGGIVRKIQESQQRRVAFWQLNNMSDRQLRDIGVSRSDIYRIAYKS